MSCVKVTAFAALAVTACAASAHAQTDFGYAAPIPCVVRASQTVRLAAPVMGVIAQVHVRPGQKVAAGDVIATFDTDLGHAELALAETRANDASAEDTAQRRIAALTVRVARLERAHRQNAVAKADVEAAQMELDTARGELARVKAERDLARIEARRARLSVEKGVVRSPVTGIVAEDLIHAGETPDVQQPIATLTVTDPLRIEAYVPATAAPAFIAVGHHSARIGGQVHDLVSDYVSPVADVSSSTISVFFTLDAPGVLPGLDCAMIAEPPGTAPGISGG